jgi:hypothetical protein
MDVSFDGHPMVGGGEWWLQPAANPIPRPAGGTQEVQP